MKRKKNLKGFTLVELIIVLAIFSVIMVVVMNFIDPVSKIMTKTSTREKTAAYVDNINEYVDKSLRFSSFVRVFQSDYCDINDNTSIVSEDDAVTNFINDYFDRAIDGNGNHVTGQVHVLKLLNEPDKAGYPSGTKDGQLAETVYQFTAGESKCVKVDVPAVDSWGNPIIDPNTGLQMMTTNITRTHEPGYPAPVITGPIGNEFVVNPEHFEHYSYFYRFGFYEFVPVSQRTVTPGNPMTALKSYDENLITNPSGTANMYVPEGGGAVQIKKPGEDDFFYSEMVPMLDSSGNLIGTEPNRNSFAISVVAYKNDTLGNSKINCTKTLTDGSTEATSIFKSPSYIATSSMALLNINPSIMTNESCVMHSQDNLGFIGSTFEKVETYAPSFSQYTADNTADPSKNSSNIFIIYVVPSEINN